MFELRSKLKVLAEIAQEEKTNPKSNVLTWQGMMTNKAQLIIDQIPKIAENAAMERFNTEKVMSCLAGEYSFTHKLIRNQDAGIVYNYCLSEGLNPSVQLVYEQLEGLTFTTPMAAIFINW
jgi:hypothetical protein